MGRGRRAVDCDEIGDQYVEAGRNVTNYIDSISESRFTRAPVSQ